MKQIFTVDVTDFPFPGFAEEFLIDSCIDNSENGVKAIEYKIRQLKLHSAAQKLIEPLRKFEFYPFITYPKIHLENYPFKMLSRHYPKLLFGRDYFNFYVKFSNLIKLENLKRCCFKISDLIRFHL